MTATEWAGLAVSVTTLMGALSVGVRFLVKHYLSELKPNGGGSMNDRLKRVEDQIDQIYHILLQK